MEAGLGEQSRQEPEYTQGAITIEKSIAHESGVCRDRHFGLVLGSCWVFFTGSIDTVEKEKLSGTQALLDF